MIGLPSIGAGLALKAAGVLAVLAVLGGAYAYVAGLRATIAEQRVAITEAVAAYDREHRTALANAAELDRLKTIHAAEIATRKRLETDLSAQRRKTVTRIQEVQRAPTANDPLPAAFDAFLRRVQ